MDPLVTEAMFQYETAGKTKLAFVNLYQASVENESTAVIGGKNGKKQLIMRVPIYHGWHDISQVGMHNRMGYEVVQDYSLSKHTVMVLEVVFEKECGNQREITRKDGWKLLNWLVLQYWVVQGRCIARKRDH
jgi:hypothetical protein